MKLPYVDYINDKHFEWENKVVIITNAPAPYRVAFFKYIQNKDSEYSFHVIYASENHQIGRQWDVPEEELGSHTFLECKVITMHRKYDDKRIVLSAKAGYCDLHGVQCDNSSGGTLVQEKESTISVVE